MKKTILIFISVLLLSFSCSKSEDSAIDKASNLGASNLSLLGDSIFENTTPISLDGMSVKFAKDIEYDSKERTKLDILIPESSKPTGLLIYVHGGSFTSGDKSYIYTSRKGGLWDFPKDIRKLLKNNIAVASINYTFLKNENEKDGVLKPMNDVKRALQYIRSEANTFNIDKTNIVLAGDSAGAGTSLWIATNDDMKDESNSDSVLRESTRVKAVSIRETQATYNTDRWIRDIFLYYGITFNNIASNSVFTSSITRLYGIESIKEYNSESTLLYKEKVDMLSLLTKDDPEIWAENVLTKAAPPQTQSIANHHPYHVKALKERADEVGVANVCYYGEEDKNTSLIDSIYGGGSSTFSFKDPSGETWVDFIIRKIKE